MHLSHKQVFLRHCAQTSPSPLSLEIEYAKGVHLYTKDSKKYIDLISGIAVSNLGHCHPKVIEAVTNQVAKHMHLMVYGEYIHTPQVELAHYLSSLLPEKLNCSYFVNSGTEACEGALKLAKRVTGRTEIITFANAYHGSSHGALSVMGNEAFKQAFRPLLPDVKIINFNAIEDLKHITEQTAAVIVEPIQGEAGVIKADESFLTTLREKCNETGTLLIFDEIQTGCGRTGTLFAFEHYKIIPDILLLAKALGGGMPIGAFVSSHENMQLLTHNPVLGHITTFGGHPVCCAAALANLKEINEKKLFLRAYDIEKMIRNKMKHPSIKDLRVYGALAAIELESEVKVMNTIQKAIQQGVITDWFLFNSCSIRIAPPLVITNEELNEALEVLLNCL